MLEKVIANTALENLNKRTGIKGTFKDTQTIAKNKDMGVDGILELTFDNQTQKLYVEIKKDIRQYHIELLRRIHLEYPQFILIAERIYPNLKKQLCQEHIPWIDGAGNIYFQKGPHFIWIDKFEDLPEKKTVNRAFTKTGLKVVFLFLHDETWLNKTHREIAKAAGIGLGNIPKIFNGLKDQHFIVEVDKNKYKMVRKRELLDQWIIEYEKELKPKIHVGNFTFLNREDERNWKKLNFDNQDYWGGEPAADLLTNMLKPQMYTIYTNKDRARIMKKFRFKPDPDGNIEINKPFWNIGLERKNIAPPLVVYADLMNTQDERNMNVAKMVYEQFLQDQF